MTMNTFWLHSSAVLDMMVWSRDKTLKNADVIVLCFIRVLIIRCYNDRSLDSNLDLLLSTSDTTHLYQAIIGHIIDECKSSAVADLIQGVSWRCHIQLLCLRSELLPFLCFILCSLFTIFVIEILLIYYYIYTVLGELRKVYIYFSEIFFNRIRILWPDLVTSWFLNWLANCLADQYKSN